MKSIPDPRSQRHPCFNKAAAGSFGRIHLPVAPSCNVQCNYCDRRYDCVNESRPGVTSSVLKPHQALEYVRSALQREPRISVVGIAGPGDPMANAAETLETLGLIHSAFPDLLMCLSSNGLELAAHAEALARCGVSHVTITCNTVDPDVGAGVYAWVRDGKVLYRGRDGAALLLERQLAAVEACKSRGMAVKVNTIVIPGKNDDRILDVSRTMAKLGVDQQNLMPMHPNPGTPFGDLAEPDHGIMRALRAQAGAILPQMTHCRRCRADAVGMLCKDQSGEFAPMLASCAALPRRAAEEERPNVAVATRHGLFVDLHLGEARELQIWGREANGRFRLRETRLAPPAGGGRERWRMLAALLADCRALLAKTLGEPPRKILDEHGINPVPFSGGIADGLRRVYGEASVGLTGSVGSLPLSS
ncbi:MAG: nitrogen fixation protein NifB [Desulfovibrionales bacterium]|nr:nitrogen fixation protein NifB [Desulfovibrionales bacterium]